MYMYVLYIGGGSYKALCLRDKPEWEDLPTSPTDTIGNGRAYIYGVEYQVVFSSLSHVIYVSRFYILCMHLYICVSTHP